MPRTILIVDDNRMNRQLLVKMLSSEYALLEADNGRQALDMLAAAPDEISAVLLDLLMPELDGYETLRLMRENESLSQIPVIVTTGSVEEGAEVKALALGANDFITKPYNHAVIRHRLRNTINLKETAAVLNSARRDDLTGLLSRKNFFAQAAELIAAKEPGHYVLACFDIDNFKVLNDQYGSAKGDQVLKFIADTFKRGFGAVGGLCSRITADNFAVLYPRSFMDTEMISDIRRVASVQDGSMLPLTFSIGRYIVDDLSLPVSAMYDRAAIAESSVKGRYDSHIAMYDPSMLGDILREQEIVSEMKLALEADQFEVWLQPQFNHATGALIGAEALVRWRHPEKGLIAPGFFIPVFERNGFVYELDKYVWERSCAILRRWLDEGRSPLPVSVNISRYDLFRDDLVEVITGLVAKYGIPVDLLRLEITESAFAKSADQIITVVNRLISAGFMVEIDDFGSGYSSLNTLKDVPADVLKLDMRFLENAENGSRGGNIVESVVRMAKWLGMPVIAEGVETMAQADYLRSIGCFYIQGYLYAKPMLVEDMERIMDSRVSENKRFKLETVDRMDNNTFWDPASMETLIFNSYVGSACIFEYLNGRIELLRANEKYAAEIGGDGEDSLQTALDLDVLELMDEENRRILHENIRQAIDRNEESTCEVVLNNAPGSPGRKFLSATVRVIARAGERLLLYATVTDVTAKREDERHIIDSAEQLRFLNEVSRDLLTGDDPERAIMVVLRKILDYFDGDRAYVFELDYDSRTTDNTYEACAPGVEPMIDMLKGIPFETVSFWLDAFEHSGHISISSVDALAEGREEERATLAAQGIDSLVAVPLRRDGRVIGFIGVDDPREKRSHVDHLEALGDYMAVVLTRRDLNACINEQNARPYDWEDK